jgi:hypothetical protein
MNPRKAEAKDRPTVQCPKCGRMAVESTTKYGIRSSCCDLWSWDRDPLVDKATHEARKELGVLLRDLNRSMGSTALLAQIKKRTRRIGLIEATNPRAMNEVSCRKVISACQDVLMDIISGDVRLK